MLLYGITLEVLYAYKLQINININKVFKDPRPFEIVARATSLDLWIFKLYENLTNSVAILQATEKALLFYLWHKSHA